MLSSFDYTKNTESLSIKINDKEFVIKLAGCANFPYFCVSDLCCLLELNNTQKVLKKYLKFDKKSLKEIEDGETSCYTKLGKHFSSDLYLSEMYTNQIGVYIMASHSKAKHASEFRELLKTEVLPGIAKITEFNLQSKLHSEFEKTYKIMEDKITQQEQSLLKQKHEKDILQSHLIKNVKINKDDVVYVITNEEDFKNNIFKIGCTKKPALRNELADMNRNLNSPYFYVFLKAVYNGISVENTFELYMCKFKVYLEETKDKVYKLYYADLESALTKIIESETQLGDFVNDNNELLFKNSINLKSNIKAIVDIEGV